ncbi:tetratricopeptide repeat protein [Candidatus Poribacteria bacterium]|nr:tetratricopeptide repeat protein [Candidatus Poribacteria bacterium]
MRFRLKVVSPLILSLTLIFLIPGCLPKGAVSPQKEIDMILENASCFQEEQDYDRAIAEFQKLLDKYPQSDQADNAQFEIGNSYRLKGDYKAAIKAYEKVNSKSELADRAKLLIGDCYLALNEVKKAREIYRSLVRKYPYLNNDEAREARRNLDLMARIVKLESEVREGVESHRDNALFEIGRIYLEELNLPDVAAERFKELTERFPKSELADDAMMMLGESYWRMAKYESPPKVDTRKLAAFVRYYYILDRYPQLGEMDLRKIGLSPHWPAGYPSRGYEKFYGRGMRYDNYYLEVRFLLSRYRDLREWRYTDFLPPCYGKAMETWNELLERYPNTDAALKCRKVAAKRLAELGRAFYNAGAPGFSNVLLHESLSYYPTPEAHIYLAYFYADARAFSNDRTSLYNKIQVFDHIKQAEKLVSPDSELASQIKQLKTWMNYRMRVEALEAKVSKLSSRGG